MDEQTQNNAYEAAYEREKRARLKAEEILENKSRELFLKNERLQESYDLLQKQQAVMLQNEKLATLGTLAAGMAHEINNPLAFVKSNIESLTKYHTSYSRLVSFIQEATNDLPKGTQTKLTKLFDEEDIEFIQEDLPELMTDTVEGLTRVRDIVMNLRSFARTQSTDRSTAKLVDGIKSTLKLLHSELKNSVNMQLNLNPLPDISCNPNELNQVFLNLIINAKQATADQKRPTITISSDQIDSEIVIKISDNGSGMSEAVQKEIFVPFFTTKPVGDGTGMGLAIAHGIIKDHNGEISVSSIEGEGTTFTIKLPIN
ncbi:MULTISPECIES: ATP-binding protein [unclassified Neptuniibacter]|uniref:sensor histidine kinase n=1 Tax=unclassified Neptuniibacter TaxID=2630693 RepID=UPI000C378FC4|nr:MULTISPECIES: ATP-binding protein [unclassified Neptuniibacter]MAY41584.1 two-component sensor histidine kinase [Oceanospirillaceae bacterium]|tara:strand:- start:24715 stop:25659 length:945 start_codon:yes stop_codon:yes gene_type:complete